MSLRTFWKITNNKFQLFKSSFVNSLHRRPTDKPPGPDHAAASVTPKLPTVSHSDSQLASKERRAPALADVTPLNKKPDLPAAAPVNNNNSESASKPETDLASAVQAGAPPKAAKQNPIPSTDKDASEPLGGALGWYDQNQIPTRDQNIPEKPGACDPQVAPEVPKKVRWCIKSFCAVCWSMEQLFEPVLVLMPVFDKMLVL